MADLTVQSSARVANDLVMSAPTVTTGDKFINTGNEMIMVNNASGAPINVTVPTPGTVDGLAIADKVVAVGAGKIGLLGPFARSTYSDPADSQKLTFICSAVATVTVAVIKRGA